MRARESQLASELFGDDLEKVIPVVRENASDSAIFDNVLELLVLSGRSIAHAVMMMVPEAYRTRRDVDPDVKGFYDFHSCMMEPWDGPAAGGRGTRPQRPATRPLGAGHRRLRRARVRDGRDDGGARACPAQGPARTRQGVPARSRGRTDRRGR
jgi:hypothetical protein